MKIDLPVTILLDCQTTDFRAIERAQKIVCTLRMELDGDGSDAELFAGYPPDKDALGEPAQCVLAYLSSRQGAALALKAKRNPADYCADEAEGAALQEEIDADRAREAQFGAGA